MAAGLSDNVQELLRPPADIARSFNVDIANKLQEFIEFFKKNKNNSCNFNSAALVLHGSCLIYGKKVEYLCNLAHALNDCLLKEKEKEEEEDGSQNPKQRKERSKHKKIIDPFCSTDIIPGKNLSCLRIKSAVKKTAAGPKKGPKRAAEKLTSFVPVDLLPLDGEETGEVFYDTRGEEIGNKGDYTLNKCRVTTEGWLLLPTVSPALVDNPSGMLEPSFEAEEECDDDVACSPGDEGYPASSGADEGYPVSSGSVASSPVVFSSQGTDEGLGSMPSTPADGAGSNPPTPGEGPAPEGVSSEPEDCPMDDGLPPPDDLPNGFENGIPAGDLPIDDPNPTPGRNLRRSQRILQDRQNEEERANVRKDDLSALRKPIEHKCTCVQPKKLRKKNDENANPGVPPITEFCNEAFFACPIHDDPNNPEKPTLMVKCFRNNSKCVNLMGRFNKKKKRGKKKKAAEPEPAEDENEDDRPHEDPVEDLQGDMDGEGEIAPPALDHDNFDIIRSNNNSLEIGANPAIADEIPMEDPLPAEPPPPEEILPEPIMDITAEYNREQQREMENFKNELEKFKMTSDITEKVRAWKKSLLPFMKEINTREKFDINLYSSRIIEAFEKYPPNKSAKQTIKFRDFCRDKEKWEIHRYFIALLPLANQGNVEIENEPIEGNAEEEDIVITLLSRQMHHLRLEEFGQNSGGEHP